MSNQWDAIRDVLDWNTLSAYPTFILGIYAMSGMILYVRRAGLIGYLFRAGFWGFGSYHWRMGYWDVVRDWMQAAGVWEQWSALSGGTAVNVFWNVASAYAALCFIYAMHLAHPVSLQKGKLWFLSPFYPILGTVREWKVFNRCLGMKLRSKK